MANKPANKVAIIRNYLPGDLEACRLLWVELTAWHRRIYRSQSIGGSDPGLQFDEHLGRVGAGRIWIAEIDEQVVGLAGLILENGEAELEPLVVSEPYRGFGIGRQLAEAVITTAQNQGAHQLKVRSVARNGTAIQFFHQIGFDILGQIELFMDFNNATRHLWIDGEQLSGKHFKI